MKFMTQAKKCGRKVAAGGAAVASFVATNAMAAIDTTAVQTGITGATTSGETVGGYVIAGVAALSVVGVIIGLVRKL